MKYRIGRSALAVSILVLFTWLLPFGQSPANAAAVGGTSFRVYDAKNRFVGHAVPAGDDAELGSMVFRHSGRVFVLDMHRYKVKGEADLYYTSSDCTGAPLIDIEGDPANWLMDVVAVGPPGMTVYARDLQAIPADVPVGSTFQEGEGPCVSLPSGSTKVTAPAVPLIDLSTQFTPPFTGR